MIKAFTEQGARVHYVLWDSFSINVGGECYTRYHGKCGAFDAVLVRGVGRSITPEKLLYRVTLLEAMEADGVIVLNPAKSLLVARNKMATMLRLSRCGLPVPESTATENPSIALRAVDSYRKAVIKPIMGSLGLGSFLAENVDQAYYVINLLVEVNQPIYLQRYIEKRGNRDLRVFVVGDKVVASIYRVSSRGWKTNIARGAKPLPASLTDEQVRLALSTTRCLGLLYSGIDIAIDNDGSMYVLEANASPLWRGLYAATGVDPARHIAEMTMRLIKQ